jgi:hypothetical protein
MFLRCHLRDKNGKEHRYWSVVEARRLTVTLRMKLANAAPGLTPRAALQSLSAIQMLEVHVPTKDGRTLIMPRHTEPEPQQKLILEKLNLRLPPQPPPRIRHGKLELPAATSSPIL